MCYSLHYYKRNLTGLGSMKGDREKIPQLFFDPRNPIKLVVIIFSILHLYKSNVVYKNIFRKLSLGCGVFPKLEAMYIYLELWPWGLYDHIPGLEIHFTF